MARSLVALVLAALAVAPAAAVYFQLAQGQQRCFIEEVPSETLVVVDYKNPDFKPWGNPEFSATGVRVTVTDPAGSVMLAKMADTAGKLAFTSQHDGEHHVCFATNNTRWFGQAKRFRIDLTFAVGEAGIDYDEVAKKESLGELELEIRRLNDKVKDIQREQAYQRVREEAFRATSESTNSRVTWFSVAQMAVAAVAAIAFVTHIKSFIASKKSS